MPGRIRSRNQNSSYTDIAAPEYQPCYFFGSVTSVLCNICPKSLVQFYVMIIIWKLKKTCWVYCRHIFHLLEILKHSQNNGKVKNPGDMSFSNSSILANRLFKKSNSVGVGLCFSIICKSSRQFLGQKLGNKMSTLKNIMSTLKNIIL